MKKGSLLAALLVVGSVLCGCGNGEMKQGQNDARGNGTGETLVAVEIPGGAEETPGAAAPGGAGGVDAQEAGPYVQPEMKGEITISCWFAGEFLDTAAERFMKLYPDVKVTIHSSDADTVEDYLTYLNTKIMTGKAEDILFTSFLPITKYSEMGVFWDLSGYVLKTPELNDENYYMNVLRAAQKDSGELYIIPYMARFDTLAFSPELMSEHGGQGTDLRNIHFSTAMDQAKQLVDETGRGNVFLIQMGPVSYADYLIRDSIGQFVDVDRKKVSLDTQEYIALLESVTALAESGYFDAGLDFYHTKYYFAATCDYDVQAAYYSMDTGSGPIWCEPLADAEGRVFIKSNSCMALNSASADKALAWEFIRYLLSDEMQTLPSLHGPAVSRRGLEAVAERQYAFYKEGNGGAGFGSEEEYQGILESWMLRINGCDTLDSAIMTLIEEENNKYFTGQQTAQETARRLQRQLEQYFNE